MNKISVVFLLVILSVGVAADPVYQVAQVDCNGLFFSVEMLAVIEGGKRKISIMIPKKPSLEEVTRRNC